MEPDAYMHARIWTRIAAIAAILSLYTIPAAAQNSRWGANYFPNVTLTTQDGVSVRFYDDLIKGKIVAINLIYTTCKYSCPLETARLAQVQKLLADRMGRDVFFYSITIDPDHDTPAVLKEYAEKFHAGPGWLFLTGSRADIDLISKKTGLYSPPNPADPDGHTPSLLVGNEVTGQWMRNSSVDNPKFLARTIGDWLNSWRGPRREMKSYADATPLRLDRGEYTFKQHCAACHTVGAGEHIGPDLLGVTKSRDSAWLARFILEPDKMLADGDPIAKELFEKYKQVSMPNLALTRADVAAIVEYLAGQDAASASRTPSAAMSKGLAVPAALLDAYLRIHESLSRDNLTGIDAAARRITAEAATLGTTADSIRSAARPLEQAADLKSARAAFGTLSDALIEYAKASNAAIGDGVHVAYCPMLKKYWLQKGTEIRNPYYGKAMLECGRINSGLPDLAR
jgi:protein SCO1/2